MISASKANIMKSFLLLILSLTAGCEASFQVKGCEGGWVKLTCKYPKEDQKYEKVEIAKSRGTIMNTTKKDAWEKEGRFSLYHDTRNKNLRIAIKQLNGDDSVEYKCKFHQRLNSYGSGEQELELKVVKDGCQTPFNQTAYETAKTNITCDFPKEHSSYDKFICKENNETCEEILSTQSSVKSNGTFTLTDTNSFNVSISNVSSQHAGVYWCGVILNIGSYRASRKKIQLEIKNITSFKRSPTIGQTFTYWCEYPQGAPIKKFICKGEDPSICQLLWSISKPRTDTGKFSIKDATKKNITITVINVTTDDTGTYWCGAQNTDNRRSNPFFCKLEMTVATTSPSTTHASGSTADAVTTAPTSTTTPPPTGVVTMICIAVLLLLLLVIIVIFIYKRFSSSRNTRNAAAVQHVREDHIYEEVQERPQETGSGNAMKTIYATANFPTNPSDSMDYSTVTFQNSTDKANSEVLIHKPSSSACEYSTVKNSQSPICSTVNKPSKTSEDPVLLTVNKTQQQ